MAKFFLQIVDGLKAELLANKHVNWSKVAEAAFRNALNNIDPDSLIFNPDQFRATQYQAGYDLALSICAQATDEDLLELCGVYVNGWWFDDFDDIYRLLADYPGEIGNSQCIGQHVGDADFCDGFMAAALFECMRRQNTKPRDTKTFLMPKVLAERVLSLQAGYFADLDKEGDDDASQPN